VCRACVTVRVWGGSGYEPKNVIEMISRQVSQRINKSTSVRHLDTSMASPVWTTEDTIQPPSERLEMEVEHDPYRPLPLSIPFRHLGSTPNNRSQPNKPFRIVRSSPLFCPRGTVPMAVSVTTPPPSLSTPRAWSEAHRRGIGRPRDAGVAEIR
jgi:hypothetical protein